MDTAAKIYAQTIFPDALSRTSPHLSAFQKALLDATPDCIKVMSVDGKLLLANRAGRIALNIPQDSGFGMPWLSLLPADVHQQGLEALREAANGHSARFSGKSVTSAAIRYWDNLLTPLIDDGGHVLSILCVSRDITAKTQLENTLLDSINRERLLSREVRHRIGNLLSVVSGLIVMTEKETEKCNDAALSILRGKLGALARAMDVAFWAETGGGGNNRIDLESCIKSVLRPYGERCLLSGSQTSIAGNAITTLALVLHELATNSIKYGSLSTEEGRVTVHWAEAGNSLKLNWVEIGSPDISALPRQGFGTEMIESIVRSSGGTIDRSWRADGLTAILALPR